MSVYGSPWTSGSSASRFWSTVCPRLASDVFNSAAPAVTVTVSCEPPTSSAISRSRVSLMRSSMPPWMYFLKPATSTTT